MTWRKRTIMELAREAGLRSAVLLHMYGKESALCDSEIEELRQLERFAELVREDEAQKYKWDIHSCGPTCTKIGCVAVREAVKAEREACAKVCEELLAPDIYSDTDKSMWDVTCMDCAEAIRARGNKHENID